MEFLGHVSHFVENGGYATAELKVSAPNMMAVVSMDGVGGNEVIADIGILGYSYIDSQGREIFHNYYDKPIEEVAYGTLYNITYLGTSDVVRQITGVTMIVRSYSGWTKGIMLVYAL